ncbi:B3 domain-containing protein Os05g0481400-like [Helianthus annuus]|uniref:B3 domain-containing protein Os05g0481400-like n=1 Tax=Helianthus annuus TaxID=4232 RepID=UPI001652D645|nr:B3 domain-containing protein Os05g0481400-like [Helianthus annuus]XP_035833485.1 B3 domain-containing protein Os05g0481400-like [Helianthus annuus]
MDKATEIQKTLENSFIKELVNSSVTDKPKMHIPADFYKQLPRCRSLKHNHVDMVMEDENKKQFKIRLVYTGKDNEEIKPTLSGGWKKFVVAHKLVEGDVLIFQFVETRKFKVYIVKKDLEEDVGSHGEDMSPAISLESLCGELQSQNKMLLVCFSYMY